VDKAERGGGERSLLAPCFLLFAQHLIFDGLPVVGGFKAGFKGGLSIVKNILKTIIYTLKHGY